MRPYTERNHQTGFGARSKVVDMTGTLLSVNIGSRTPVTWGRADAADPGHTGIDKRPTDRRVALGADGVDGDAVVDRRHHGGTDKAVYAYAREDADWWQEDLGRPIGDGAFGENLTLRGIDVTGAVIGEHWAIGGAVLEVCQPRLPCTTFAGFWGVPDLIKRFTAHAAPGAYLRVVQAGDVGAGDTVTVTDVPDHGVTIGEVFRAVNGEVALLPRLLAAAELPDRVRAKAARRLGVDVRRLGVDVRRLGVDVS
jgi:MOSC domain-containing protein YiiM